MEGIRPPLNGATAEDSELPDRVLLLELAASLQSRPVRNQVARRALDFAASQLTYMALYQEAPANVPASEPAAAD